MKIGRVIAAVFAFWVLTAAAPPALPETPAPPEAPGGNEESVVYDLYIMSLCPYGIQALGGLVELVRAFPQREWNVWFVGTVDGDRLASLRGEAEMFDEALWLGVKALYPFRYHEFLFQRSSSAARTEVLLEEMDFDVRKIRRWAEDVGPSELRKHYARSMRLNVNASPTLFIDNRLYEGPVTAVKLVYRECRAANPAPRICGEYPECFEDDDCQMPGKLGRCVHGDEAAGGRAFCEFRDDAGFTLTVLVADSAADSPEKQPIEALTELLPGARVNIVKLSSDEGGELLLRYVPRALPFFHFGGNVVNAYRYSAINETLTAVSGDGFTFKRGVVGENYFPNRAEKRGVVELYVDPLMPDIGKIINILQADPAAAKRVILKPLLFNDPDAELTPQERYRSEEALRWLVLANEFPKQYPAYLGRYAASPGSSFWFDWLKGIRVNQKKFLRALAANRKKLAAHWESFEEVSSGEPVIMLIDNRVKVPVPNEKELARVLNDLHLR